MSEKKALLTPKQKKLALAINVYMTTFLMFYITTSVKAYIGMFYPDVPDTLVTSLISLPTICGLIAAVLVGPVSMKVSKIGLMIFAMASMGVYGLIMFWAGITHAAFGWLVFATVIAGIGQGVFAPLANTLISENFLSEDRAKMIARYNVWENLGAFVILMVSGRIAAGNDGANWPYAYLLSIACFATTLFFYIMVKKAGVHEKEVAPEVLAQQSADKVSIKDVPVKLIVYIVLIALIHCFYYVGINSYYLNVSNYIITEHNLGSSVQSGNAGSIVRAVLVVSTFIFPFWEKILKKWMIPFGYCVPLVGLFLMYNFTDSLFGIYGCAACVAIGTSIVHSSFYSRATTHVPLRIVPLAISIMWGIANCGAYIAVYWQAWLAPVLGGGMNGKIIAGMICLVGVIIASIVAFVVKAPKSQVELEAEKRAEA